uniref:Uncharacterized protein n=1 Tax=Romanomermis culicivorax TaxID=13658 RepID=A0A915I3C1_ROMCU
MAKDLTVYFVILLFFLHILRQSVACLKCYACPPYPCEKFYCEGSSCSKLVLTVRDGPKFTKTVRECAPQNLELDHTEASTCQIIESLDLKMMGKQCYCQNDLCNNTGKYHYRDCIMNNFCYVLVKKAIQDSPMGLNVD